MKRGIILSLILILSFAVAGCGKKKPAAMSQEKASEPQGGMMIGETDNSLLGWLKRGQGVECVIESGQGEVVVQSKEGKVRMSGVPYVGMDAALESGDELDNNGVSLTTGDWTYMWSERDKKGTKMNLNKLKALAKDSESAKKQESWDKTVAGWENEKDDYKCENKNLADSLFVPPSDVEFSDFTEFMLGVGDMGKQLQKQTEEGNNLDPEALKKQAEELQKKYGDTE